MFYAEPPFSSVVKTTYRDLGEEGHYEITVRVRNCSEANVENRAYELSVEDIEGTRFQFIVWESSEQGREYNWKKAVGIVSAELLPISGHREPYHTELHRSVLNILDHNVTEDKPKFSISQIRISEKRLIVTKHWCSVNTASNICRVVATELDRRNRRIRMFERSPSNPATERSAAHSLNRTRMVTKASLGQSHLNRGFVQQSTVQSARM